jgi:uncharacterized membrane protein
MSLEGSSLVFKRIRTWMLRGALFVIPIWLTLFVVGILYSMCETWLGGATEQLVRWFVPSSWLAFLNVPDGHIPGMSLVTALLMLATLGMIASWTVGARGLRLIDHLFLAIPGVKTIYKSTRQIIDAVGDPTQSRFQKVVLVAWPTAGVKTIGFVTNEVVEPGTGKRQYYVFIPTVPNPTAGFVVIVDENDVTLTDYTPEEGLRLAISLGVSAPGSSR